MQNVRTVSTTLRKVANASASGEVLLAFVTVDHPQLARTIRVVAEDDGGISYANGKPINYMLDGNLYDAAPFRLGFLSDNEQPTQVQAVIPSIDRKLNNELKGLTAPARIRLRIIKSSSFDELFDENNARNPIGTPTIEVDADYLFLRDVEGNAATITGTVSRFDFGNMMYPPERAIKSLTPALFL